MPNIETSTDVSMEVSIDASMRFDERVNCDKLENILRFEKNKCLK